MNSLFLSLSCLSLSPPKQQFFNCAIDEIHFPVSCLAAVLCLRVRAVSLALPRVPSYRTPDETARVSQDPHHLILSIRNVVSFGNASEPSILGMQRSNIFSLSLISSLAHQILALGCDECVEQLS
jgi:hypothetical protein